MKPQVVLIHISPIDRHDAYFLRYFSATFFYLLLRTLSSGLRPIFLMNTLILLLLEGSYCLYFLSSSFILDINPLLDSVGFFTKCFFSCAEDFGFHEVPLIKLIVLNSWANRVIFRKSFSTTIPCRVLLVFPSRSFGGFDLTFRSLAQLESVFVRGGRFHSSLCGHLFLPALSVEDTACSLFFVCLFACLFRVWGIFVKYQMAAAKGAHALVFSFDPWSTCPRSTCLSLCQYHAVFIAMAL